MNTSNIKLATKFASRDIRGGLKGLKVFIACLAIGVGAIALVGSVSQAIVVGLKNDGQKILGGDISLRLAHRAISKTHIQWLEEKGDLSSIVSMRSMAFSATEKRTLINLKAVDKAYPLYGSLKLKPDLPTKELFAQRADAWGAAVNSIVLDRLDLKLNDYVTVGNTSFQIRAILEKEPDPMGGVRGITLGPRFLVSQDSLKTTGLVKRGAQVTYDYRLRLPSGTDIAVFRKNLEQTFPNVGWRIQDRTRATVGIERVLKRTTQFVTLVALAALLIGGVGVSNATRSYMAEKTNSIATLKCLGASQTLIFYFYTIELLFITFIATILGIAFGAAIPLLFANTLSSILPVPFDAGIYPKPLFWASIFGFLTAFSFFIWPLERACETPPGALFRSIFRRARFPNKKIIFSLITGILALSALAIITAQDKTIASWFLLGSSASFLIFFWAGKLVEWGASKFNGCRNTEIRLAIANLHRPGAQTSNVILSVGLGLTVLVAVLVVEQNITRQLKTSLPERAPDYYFIDIQPNQVGDFDSIIKSSGSVDILDRVPMLRGRILKINGLDSHKVKVTANKRWVLRNDRGLTWARQPPMGASIVAGEWWPSDYDGPPLISFDAEAAQAMGIGVGDTLTIDILGRPIIATISSLRKIQWENLGINFVIIFSPGFIEHAPQTHIAAVRMAKDEDTDIEKIVTSKFRNISAVRVRDVLDTLSNLMVKVGWSIRAVAIITLISGILVLSGAIAATHHRRIYDSVILKVLGAQRYQVSLSFLLEYGLLAFATASIAAFIGSAASWAVITQVMRSDWLPAWGAVLGTVSCASILILIGGLIGTWQALGRKAAPILRND